jgi:TonB-linked SusC/RagA family outer membrane protein
MKKQITEKIIKTSLLMLVLMCIYASGYAQEMTIRGVVNDNNTSPLPGVSIMLKGTNVGTVTDVDGNYTIKANDNDILVFSFIGYTTQEIAVNKRTSINITMTEDVQSLKEVVVVGYGTREKGRLTGSVGNIGGEELERIPTMDIQKGLEGRIPGLVINDRGGNPGRNNLSMLIRGKSTLGSNSPLVVIDGIPQGASDLGNMAPEDIESISVLKDAAAAIYGARAANGVILVTTKRGIEGKSEITINSSFGVSSFTRTPKLMNSYQHSLYYNEMEERYGRSRVFSEDDLNKFKSGDYPYSHPDADWNDATFRDFAPETNHNITIRGGAENVKFFISGSYFNQNSMYKRAMSAASEDDDYAQPVSKFGWGDMGFKRYQIRSNIDAQVMKNLNVGVDLLGRVKDIHEPVLSESGIFHRVQLSLPQDPPWYPNGLPGYGAVGYNVSLGTSDQAGWKDEKEKEFISKLSFDYDMDWLTEGLSLNGYASYSYDISNNENLRKTWTLYTYNPGTEELDEQTGTYSEGQKYSSLQKDNSVDLGQLYHMRLNYEKSFGGHNFNSFIAYEQSENYYERLSGYRRDLISYQKLDLYAASTDQMSSTGVSSETGRVNYFGYLGYDFKRKYLIDFTLRRDGSFNFAENKRFGTFPSVSLGWNISDEPFLAFTEDWLNNLKFRASWAIMGNDNVPNFQYLTKYNLSTRRGFYVFGEDPQRYESVIQSNVPNPDITWEKAKTLNFGFDAVILQGLTMNVDYFYEKRRDILIARNASVPVYTGLQLPDENLGKVDNSGIEIKVNYQSQIGSFRYNIGGNFMNSQNKIVFMDEAKDVPDYRRKEGHPLDSWVIYKTDGIFNTQEEIDNTEATLTGTKPGDIKYVDVDGDGSITANDMVRRFSSQIPEIQYGINAGLEYKGFSLNIFLQGQAKAENHIAHNRGGNSNLPLYLFTNRWTQNNTDASYPRAYERNDNYNYRPAEFWLYDASFIRLKNVTLSYNLPSEMLSGKSVQLYFKGHNLWTIDSISKQTGSKDYDPEMSNGEGKYYPQLTLLTAGISIKL